MLCVGPVFWRVAGNHHSCDGRWNIYCRSGGQLCRDRSRRLRADDRVCSRGVHLLCIDAGRVDRLQPHSPCLMDRCLRRLSGRAVYCDRSAAVWYEHEPSAHDGLGDPCPSVYGLVGVWCRAPLGDDGSRCPHYVAASRQSTRLSQAAPCQPPTLHLLRQAAECLAVQGNTFVKCG